MKRTPGWKAMTRTSGVDLAVSLGLAAVLFFFLVSGSVAYLNLQTISDDNDKISHSHEVIVALEKALSSAQDAETGQRGFLLTGNESYLEPYNAAVADLPSQIDGIAQMTRDNPVQQQHVGPLKAHVLTKLAELKRTIELRRAGDLTGAMAVVDTNSGKAEMDAIRGQLALMAQEEETLRNQRLAEMAAAERTALGSGIISGLVGIVLTLIVGYLVRQGFRRPKAPGMVSIRSGWAGSRHAW